MNGLVWTGHEKRLAIQRARCMADRLGAGGGQGIQKMRTEKPFKLAGRSL